MLTVGQLLVSLHFRTKEGEEEVLGLQLSEEESGEEEVGEEEEEEEDEEFEVGFMVSDNVNLVGIT